MSRSPCARARMPRQCGCQCVLDWRISNSAARSGTDPGNLVLQRCVGRGDWSESGVEDIGSGLNGDAVGEGLGAPCNNESRTCADPRSNRPDRREGRLRGPPSLKRSGSFSYVRFGTSTTDFGKKHFQGGGSERIFIRSSHVGRREQSANRPPKTLSFNFSIGVERRYVPLARPSHR